MFQFAPRRTNQSLNSATISTVIQIATNQAIIAMNAGIVTPCEYVEFIFAINL